MADFSIDLPPGYRFHPTDVEIITHYLSPKAMDPSLTTAAIGEIDLHKCEPWDLPCKAKMGGKEWYFFCHKDRKYPTGTRINRATEAGYWKATGKDKEIFQGKDVLVGMKKTLVFYMGRAPKGEKTNWVMNEFRIEGNPCTIPRISQDEWVVSRVFHKNMTEKKVPLDELEAINSFGKESVPDSPDMPVLLDATYFSIGDFGSSSCNMTLNTGKIESSDKLSCNPTPYTTAVSPQFPTYLQKLTGALAATDASGSAQRKDCKAGKLSRQSTIVSASPDIGGVSTNFYTEIPPQIGCSYNFELGDHRTSEDPVIYFNNIWNC